MTENGIGKTSQALAALLETAREIDEQIAASATGLDAAEGQRFLLRMLAASVDTYVEQEDADRPAFHHAETPTRKMFADCPDTDYFRAPIRLGPGRVYRLWGRVPENALYLGILLYGKGGRIGNRLTDRELGPDGEGCFEIRVATEEQPGTWLRGEGDETAVMVRQYFSNRAEEPPLEVEIELIGDPPPPPPLDAADLAGRIGRAERMLKAVVERTRQALQMATTAAVNKFMVVPGEQLFPTPDNTYSVAWYRLEEGESIRLRGRLPKARYFSVSLCNAWLESLDYRHHQVALNHRQIVLEPDGGFEITLADDDPGQANWLDTAGHRQGYVLARALLPEEEMPALELEVVPA
jgi:hypothetical protein